MVGVHGFKENVSRLPRSFIHLITVRLKFVSLPILLWEHVPSPFPSPHPPSSPASFPFLPSFLFHEYFQDRWKNDGSSASKFRTYVRNRTPGDAAPRRATFSHAAAPRCSRRRRLFICPFSLFFEMQPMLRS